MWERGSEEVERRGGKGTDVTLNLKLLRSGG